MARTLERYTNRLTAARRRDGHSGNNDPLTPCRQKQHSTAGPWQIAGNMMNFLWEFRKMLGDCLLLHDLNFPGFANQSSCATTAGIHVLSAMSSLAMYSVVGRCSSAVAQLLCVTSGRRVTCCWATSA